MKRMMVIAIVVLSLCTGCATLKEWLGLDTRGDERLAEELAWDGMDNYREGNYKTALDAFQRLKDWYPFSKYAMLAELKIADCQYKIEAYEDAIDAYEEFQKLHPRNEAIPYVIYQIGRCYFDRIDSPDRDQSTAQKALDVFQRLQAQFPDDVYSKRAEAHIKICLKSMAESEFLIGVYYYKSKHYRGALNRFKAVLTKYPDMGIHQKALTYIVRCEANITESEATTK